MQPVAVHELLVSAENLDESIRRVERFLRLNQLVRYETVEIRRDHCCPGDDPVFAGRIEAALAATQRAVGELCRELGQSGCHSLDDLATLEQGYQSKLLHTLTHLLDGFFGIDSAFFDLDEGSHQLTAARRRQLRETPHRCWLVPVHTDKPDGSGFERQVLMPR